MENTENPVRFKFLDPNQIVDRHAKAIGIFLALSTGIMFSTNGALIKVWSVNFVDAVMVRCVIQTLIAGSIMICLGLCKSTTIFKRKVHFIWYCVSVVDLSNNYDSKIQSIIKLESNQK